MKLALDGTMVRMAVIVLSAVAVYIGLWGIIHIGLPGVIPNKITHEMLHTGMLMVTYSGLLYVGYWKL